MVSRRQNLAWKAPYVDGQPNRYGQPGLSAKPAGKGELEQERVMCFNADDGALLWEHRFNIYLSDVPPHRVGWASPVGDPGTGNVYVLGVGGNLLGLNREGKLLWERSLGEDFGLLTTHGGRTVSPIIDGDLVIIGGGFQGTNGPEHKASCRVNKTGDTIGLCPGGRPYVRRCRLITNVKARACSSGRQDGALI